MFQIFLSIWFGPYKVYAHTHNLSLSIIYLLFSKLKPTRMIN